jgi:hypothetical protein
MVFQENNEKVVKQKETDIRVIIGNPPYSVGQNDANQGNQNMRYPDLDESISDTYVKLSSSKTRTSVYDSYFKAFRWASNRLKEQGVICFVTNGSWIDSNSADGFRKSLSTEFSSAYVFNLRGNARTVGEQRRMEAGNVFGEGSRTPVAITLLVRNLKHQGPANIFYYDIGDYLTRDEKLKSVSTFGDIQEIPWTRLTPNDSGDWINQRDSSYMKFLPLGDKNTKGSEGPSIFRIYSNGIITHRDAWTYNFSKVRLQGNMSRMIDNYNNLIDERAKSSKPLESFVRTDKKLISWNASLLKDFEKNKKANFNADEIILANYRPFQKQYLYSGRQMIWSPYRIPSIFPKGKDNLIINTTGLGTNTDFSALMSELPPDVQVMSNSQGFPRYYYVDEAKVDSALTLDMEYSESKIDAISDWALGKFRERYGLKVSKDDIYYYVYGVLSSPEFVRKYKNELKKDSPRVPLLDEFVVYVNFGRELARLHLNYENCENSIVKLNITEKAIDDKKLYRVDKMRFSKSGEKSEIQYNQYITISNIPQEVFSYFINGKSAVDWVMDRYLVKEDADSGNTNDPNDYSEDPKYIFKLLLSVIAMSMDVMELQKSLPKLKIPED